MKMGAMAVVYPGTKGDNTEANWISWFQEYPPEELHEIFYCEENQSLVYLLLNLLRRLRDIGMVPAIDFSKYAEEIPSRRYEK